MKPATNTSPSHPKDGWMRKKKIGGNYLKLALSLSGLNSSSDGFVFHDVGPLHLASLASFADLKVKTTTHTYTYTHTHTHRRTTTDLLVFGYVCDVTYDVNDVTMMSYI